MADKKGATASQPKGASIRVSPDLRRRAKVHAAQTNRSLMAVADEALAEYLKKRGA